MRNVTYIPRYRPHVPGPHIKREDVMNVDQGQYRFHKVPGNDRLNLHDSHVATIAGEEEMLYKQNLSGVHGPLAKAQAQQEGLEGIVFFEDERGLLRDYLTGYRYECPYTAITRPDHLVAIRLDRHEKFFFRRRSLGTWTGSRNNPDSNFYNVMRRIMDLDLGVQETDFDVLWRTKIWAIV